MLNTTIPFLNPAEAAVRLGVSAKALRLYEQRGLLAPSRNAAGWRLPANHAPPTRVAPYAGAPGYEAVATCLGTPEARARTAGVVAWRPPTAAAAVRATDFQLQGD